MANRLQEKYNNEIKATLEAEFPKNKMSIAKLEKIVMFR